MRPTYLLYMAIEEERRADARRRCCTDESRTVRTEPTAPGRWARKLARAVPASASAFRGTFRHPLPATAATAGDAVVTSSGTPVGRVGETYVGLESGRAAVAMVTDDTSSETVLLLSPDAVRSRRTGVVVLDQESSRRVA